MKQNFSRRRFLQHLLLAGAAPAVAACERIYRAADGMGMQQAAGRAPNAHYYPPALTGLRGDHEGSQYAAHSAALQGKRYQMPSAPSGQYDLIVIGAGISGLTAAYLYRRAKPQAKILILDNHDDFGGHAKRNEFRVDGRLLLTYGGSESIDAPESNFSEQAMAVLRDLGVDYRKFGEYFQQDLYEGQRGLKNGVFFDQAAFGSSKVVAGMPSADGSRADNEALIAQFPLADADKAALAALYRGRDYWAGKSRKRRERDAQTVSYESFLRDTAGLPEGALAVLQNISAEYWGVPINALSVQEAWENGYPGVQGLGLKAEHGEEEPYIYHFPDGNASIARLLVRRLIPSVADGNTMEDVVLADFDYSRLDRPEENVCIRLNSTALLAENREDGQVAVAYLRQGGENLEEVRAPHCIFAGHSALSARIMPQMPQTQREAVSSNVKTPMVYTKVAVRDTRAFQKLGVHSIYAPKAPYCLVKLDDAVDMGGYVSPKSADEPAVVHMVRIATAGDGATVYDQYRHGRRMLIGQSEDVLREEALNQLAEIYRAAGERLEDKVAAVTINRWAHGYSYEALGLWNSEEEAESQTKQMQQPVGRIHMAGSDVAWYPYLQGAFEQAHRAVGEILGV